MKRMYEFRCNEGHITERLCRFEDITTTCSTCSQAAERIISTPQISLEGVSGDFPGAKIKWEQKHTQHLKRNAS